MIVVSSGAIALGRHMLKLPKGALELEKSQAAAAVGQISLAGAYQAVFKARGLVAAQQRVATTPQTSFTTSAFRNRIADVYREGAGIVVAADLEKVVARVGPLHSAKSKDPANAAKHDQALNELGVTNLNSFVLDQKETNGKTHTRAVLSYDQTDRGITSWLAQPGPMGSLEYISPDANLVAGFVIKNPTAVVDDLLRVITLGSPDVNTHLDKLEREHGLNVRNDSRRRWVVSTPSRLTARFCRRLRGSW